MFRLLSLSQTQHSIAAAAKTEPDEFYTHMHIPSQITPAQSHGGSCAHTRPALRGIENHCHGGQIHEYTALVRLFLVTALSENNILFSATDTKKKQTQTKICLPLILLPNFPSAEFFKNEIGLEHVISIKFIGPGCDHLECTRFFHANQLRVSWSHRYL